MSNSVLESVRSEFAGLRTEFAGLRSDVASNAATLNEKVESSSTALKETMKVREVRHPSPARGRTCTQLLSQHASHVSQGGFLLKVVAAVAGTMGFMEVLGYQIRIVGQNGKSA